jgi:NAD(P)-dependent dehydrogenase (short-subunit alcohol dehydrogenase family)
VLVNNAAAYVDWSETASQARLDDARHVMETNLFGAWRVTAALLPDHDPRGGLFRDGAPLAR